MSCPNGSPSASFCCVVLYTIAQPHHAADIANGTWNIADNAGHRLSSFVSDLHS